MSHLSSLALHKKRPKQQEVVNISTHIPAVQRVLAIARQEVGYHEKASSSGLDDKTANSGGANWTKYARDLDAIPGFYNGPKNGYAWCDVFYDWLIVAAFGPKLARQLLCQPENSAGAGCLYSSQYYLSAGRYFDRGPQPGDQVFFSYSPGEVSHTGIVEAVNGSTVTTIEGNSSDAVVRRTYPIGSGSICGYGRPDWSLVNEVSDPDTGDGDQDDADPDPIPVSPAGPTCLVELPVLKQGDTGVPVERMQTLLIGRGYYCGGRRYSGREQPDGEFGPATEVAILDVQAAAGIEQDGEVEKNTWLALITN